MDQVCAIGLDIAKNVFQVHGVDQTGAVVIRRQVRRRQVLALFGKLPPGLVGIEACATAHYWARELASVAACVNSVRIGQDHGWLNIDGAHTEALPQSNGALPPRCHWLGGGMACARP